jgi:hypothetical protein
MLTTLGFLKNIISYNFVFYVMRITSGKKLLKISKFEKYFEFLKI